MGGHRLKRNLSFSSAKQLSLVQRKPVWPNDEAINEFVEVSLVFEVKRM